ncbi:MAG: DNA-directed RNA polymerase subunit H [Nanoarchaeota archaeon]|nr:DNA-directed RNA polymerase subunit H [Nanoarchaeota archaeon]MBU1051404.1 DNA-directed RNA polymerase subunit H [Nanoarchaeota archaeon]MBU1989019.1 DNA-directed RNA polymerase subunit H [Nanoarchaeota archaeon]
MHILQPKHTKLKPDEVKKLLNKYNLSFSQLPRIRIDDPVIPEECTPGDVFKVERREGDKIVNYFRVVVL